MTLNGIHKQHFLKRLTETEKYAEALMTILLGKKHFKSFRKATKEEDLNGIDWWVVYPGEKTEVPIQFKIRDKQSDVPMCLFQPFHGIDEEKTVMGRDYRGLKDKVSTQYYVGIRNGSTFKEIYRVSCDKLRPLVFDVYKKWNKVKDVFDNFPPSFFDKKKVEQWINANIWNKRVFNHDNGQIWWKKNGNEKAAKFNMYLPYNIKEWGVVFNTKDIDLIEAIAQKETV